MMRYGRPTGVQPGCSASASAVSFSQQIGELGTAAKSAVSERGVDEDRSVAHRGSVRGPWTGRYAASARQWYDGEAHGRGIPRQRAVALEDAAGPPSPVDRASNGRTTRRESRARKDKQPTHNHPPTHPHTPRRTIEGAVASSRADLPIWNLVFQDWGYWDLGTWVIETSRSARRFARCSK